VAGGKAVPKKFQQSRPDRMKTREIRLGAMENGAEDGGVDQHHHERVDERPEQAHRRRFVLDLEVFDDQHPQQLVMVDHITNGSRRAADEGQPWCRR